MSANVSTVVRPVRIDPSAEGEARSAGTTTREWYVDPSGRFRAGIWTSEPKRNETRYRKDELCVLLQGVVRLTAEDGHVETYRAGDAFIVPNGFRGTWETVETVRKVYAV